MNRDDLMRMAQEAKLFDAVDGCENCFLRIPNLDAVERFAFIFLQAARAEMIKEGWRFCAEGQHTTQFCALLEAAVRAEREACAELCEEKQTYSMPIPCPDGISGCCVAHVVPARREKTGAECSAAIRARNKSGNDTQ